MHNYCCQHSRLIILNKWNLNKNPLQCRVIHIWMFVISRKISKKHNFNSCKCWWCHGCILRKSQYKMINWWYLRINPYKSIYIVQAGEMLIPNQSYAFTLSPIASQPISLQLACNKQCSINRTTKWKHSLQP